MLNSKMRKSRLWFWLKIIAALGIVLTATVAVLLWVFIPSFIWTELIPAFRLLPSDGEMITNFQNHRADFEHLVDIYRKDPSIVSERGLLVPTPEMEAIMNRINVYALKEDGEIWIPPDPYAHQSSELFAHLKTSRGSLEKRKVSGVILLYKHKPVKRFNSYLSGLYKSYYYTPFPPRVTGRILRAPIRRYPLYPNLTWCPKDLIDGGCIYRQYEPQWFIELCQG